MKSKTIFFVVFFITALSFSHGLADVPALMQYQGVLTDEAGEPLDDTLFMTFTIYDQPTEGSVIWGESLYVAVTNGLFNVLLGSLNPIEDVVFADTERWLGIMIDPDPEIVPRTRLVTVPWAYRAATLDGASGGAVFGDLHLHSTLTVGSLEEGEPGRIEVTDGVDPVIIADGATGQVGIGGIDVDAQFHAATPDRPYAGTFKSAFPDPSTHVIHSEFVGTGAYDAVAVYGISTPADHYGFGGVFEGGWVGVVGLVFPTGSGVYCGASGEVSGGTGWNFGVYGVAEGAGRKVGVQGEASGDSLNFGVQGYAAGTSEFAGNWGVFGSAGGLGARYGICGDAGGAVNDYAGWFHGNVDVTGILSKGGGGFKIDHPVDPENKYLYHSFVESPDMKNVYDGVVVLDPNGEAMVELPDYFDAVNEDFRYQLTCIGGFAPVYIAEEISGNRFAIAGGEPGMKISWQVTGIRKDAFAEAYRIQVEVDKPERERGKYLHPEAHGVGEEFGIHYEELKQVEEMRQAKTIRRMDQRQSSK